MTDTKLYVRGAKKSQSNFLFYFEHVPQLLQLLETKLKEVVTWKQATLKLRKNECENENEWLTTCRFKIAMDIAFTALRHYGQIINIKGERMERLQVYPHLKLICLFFSFFLRVFYSSISFLFLLVVSFILEFPHFFVLKIQKEISKVHNLMKNKIIDFEFNESISMF